MHIWVGYFMSFPFTMRSWWLMLSFGHHGVFYVPESALAILHSVRAGKRGVAVRTLIYDKFIRETINNMALRSKNQKNREKEGWGRDSEWGNQTEREQWFQLSGFFCIKDCHLVELLGSLSLPLLQLWKAARAIRCSWPVSLPSWIKGRWLNVGASVDSESWQHKALLNLSPVHQRL